MADPIELNDVRVTFGTLVALKGLSLSVAAGEIVGLLGPNGAGKTTTVDVCCGLRAPDERHGSGSRGRRHQIAACGALEDRRRPAGLGALPGAHGVGAPAALGRTL